MSSGLSEVLLCSCSQPKGFAPALQECSSVRGEHNQCHGLGGSWEGAGQCPHLGGGGGDGSISCAVVEAGIILKDLSRNELCGPGRQMCSFVTARLEAP